MLGFYSVSDKDNALWPMQTSVTVSVLVFELHQLSAAFVLTLLSSCSSQLSLNAVRKGSSLESAIREGLDSAL